MPRLSMKTPPPLHLAPGTIGQRIAMMRKQQGLTQAQLAEQMGVSRHTVADYENDRARLYDEMLARLSLALKTTADAILGLLPDREEGSNPSLRVMKRLLEIDQLPEPKKKAILKTLDDLIRANS